MNTTDWKHLRYDYMMFLNLVEHCLLYAGSTASLECIVSRCLGGWPVGSGQVGHKGALSGFLG